MKARFERARRAWHDLKRRLTRAERPAARLRRRAARYAWYGSAVVLAGLAVVVTAARLMLPQLAERRADLEEYLSRWTTHTVRIEGLSTYWDGLHPGLHIQGLAVYVEDRPQPSVRLDQVRLSLAVFPLLWGELRIHSLVLDGPKLSLERLVDGRYRISGFDPIHAEEQAGDEGFFHWLFRQQRLAIENGELQWFDHREPDSALHLSRVNLTLRNRGDRHKLGMTASFPEGVCGDCAFAADVTGNPFMREPWKGRIYVRARDVDLARFPLLVRERLPQALRGRFIVELWSEWKDMWPRAVHGAVNVADLRLPVRGLRSPLAIREASGDLDWKGSAESWQLDLRRLRLALTGEVWDAGRVRLVRRPRGFQAHAKYVDLDDITGFMQHLHANSRARGNDRPWGNGWIARWAALAPGGSIRNLRLELEGDPDSPDDFLLEADLTQVKVQAYGGLPGVQGVSGHVRTRHHTGEFHLNASDAVITMPGLFREPLPAGRVSGRLVWERRATEWLVSGTELSLRAPDGEGSGRLALRVPHDTAVSPHLTLHANFRNGNGANAKRYYPAGVLDPGVLAWMDRSFLGGVVTTARLVYDGPVRAFPFRQGEGKFELRAHVRNGIYRYLPGWEPVRQAEADVLIHGENVLITGYGRIGELAASDVVVRGERAQNDYAVRVLGNVTGPVDETLRVLRDVEAPSGKGGWKDYLPDGLRGSGAGRLSLDVGIRLHDDEEEVRLAGEYRFLSGGLKLPEAHLAVDALDGEVRFSEAGVREGALSGRFLGGEARLAIATSEQGGVRAHAEGRLDAKALAPFLGKQIALKVSGGADWQATLRWHKGMAALQAEVALAEIKTALPPPLDHPQGLPVEKLMVKTETSTAAAHVLTLAAGSGVTGRFAFEKAPVWRFVRGRLAIGEPLPAALPGRRGLYLSAGLERLDADPWLRLLGDGQLLTGYLAHVRADVHALRLFERDFGREREPAGGSRGGHGAPAASGAAHARGAGPCVSQSAARQAHARPRDRPAPPAGRGAARPVLPGRLARSGPARALGRAAAERLADRAVRPDASRHALRRGRPLARDRYRAAERVRSAFHEPRSRQDHGRVGCPRPGGGGRDGRRRPPRLAGLARRPRLHRPERLDRVFREEGTLPQTQARRRTALRRSRSLRHRPLSHARLQPDLRQGVRLRQAAGTVHDRARQRLHAELLHQGALGEHRGGRPRGARDRGLRPGHGSAPAAERQPDHRDLGPVRPAGRRRGAGPAKDLQEADHREYPRGLCGQGLVGQS
jgi:uncharacterized protein YhdP